MMTTCVDSLHDLSFHGYGDSLFIGAVPLSEVQSTCQKKPSKPYPDFPVFAKAQLDAGEISPPTI
jgi:hypothetical protein